MLSSIVSGVENRPEMGSALGGFTKRCSSSAGGCRGADPVGADDEASGRVVATAYEGGESRTEGSGEVFESTVTMLTEIWGLLDAQPPSFDQN